MTLGHFTGSYNKMVTALACVIFLFLEMTMFSNLGHTDLFTHDHQYNYGIKINLLDTKRKTIKFTKLRTQNSETLFRYIGS